METAKFGHDFGPATKLILRCLINMSQSSGKIYIPPYPGVQVIECGEPPATDINPEANRAKWLKRLAGELDKIEVHMPVKFLPDGIDYPPWVLKVEREFSLVMLPAAKLKDPNFKITPKRMGALLGHMCEMAVWLMEWFYHQAKDGDVKKDNPLVEKPLTEEEWKKGQEYLVSLKNWYCAMRRMAKRALCSCVDQTYEDMTDFLLGYSDAFSRKPKTFQVGNIGNPTFEIYIFMLIFWRAIERMDSVRQLHEKLVEVFGANRIGDQKRIEKICQRMGLSFRKPGRPKKLIQTPA
jgi:hypothetical protein